MPRREKTRPEADLEPIELEVFQLVLFRRYGYDFRNYDPEFIRKQALRRMTEEGIESLSRLSELLLRDPAVLERFLAQFAKTGAALFQPAGFWKAFRERVIPFLRTYPSLRLWLAGGSSEDLFSLSILLEESLPRNVQIYATDLHESLLDGARSGVLESRKVTAGAKEYRSSGGEYRSLGRYFDTDNGSAVLAPGLRKKILFASHNPVTDGTFQQCHGILARNLLEPLEPELRAKTCRLLHSSLITLGFLALGPKDDLQASPLKDLYKEVDKTFRIYQKIRD